MACVHRVLPVRGVLLGLSLLAGVASCAVAPSYPKDRVVEGLLTLLQEAHVRATVTFVDHTVGVQVHQPEMLLQAEGQVGMGSQFDTVVGDTVQAIHRVILSSDADIRFYAVVVSDPGLPGLYVHLVRYMDDIRRANASMIGPEELFARTVLDLQTVEPPPAAPQPPENIRLEEFLSWQAAKRIQQALIEELELSGQVVVGRCLGQFTDGEFAFTLNVNPSTQEKPLDDTTLQQVFQTSTSVVTEVLANYRFENFNAVRLIHPITGRHLLLPRAQLDLVIKRP
jgi:hypothetical protein